MKNKPKAITRPKDVEQWLKLLNDENKPSMLTFEIDGKNWNFYWLQHTNGSTILTDCGDKDNEENYKEICEFGKLEGHRHFFQTIEVFKTSMPKWVRMYKETKNKPLVLKSKMEYDKLMALKSELAKIDIWKITADLSMGCISRDNYNRLRDRHVEIEAEIEKIEAGGITVAVGSTKNRNQKQLEKWL